MDNRKPRVRVSWLSASVWLVKWAGGLVVKLEKTRTGLIRVRSIYFSGNANSVADSIDRLHAQNFEFNLQHRDAVYCTGRHEVRVCGKVQQLIAIEKFVIVGFLDKWRQQQNRVIDRSHLFTDRKGKTYSIG